MYERMVYITGMPRCGSTWVSQILAAHPDVRLKFCPLFSYEFRGRCDAGSSAADWRALFREVYSTPGRFLDQDHLRDHGYVPTLTEVEQPPMLAIKSNRFHDCTPPLVEKLPEITWLALTRDPVRALASWVNNPTEFGPHDTVDGAWRSGGSRKSREGEYWGFDDWKSVATTHIELAGRFPDRVHLLAYEELASDPVGAAETILAKAGLATHPTVTSFATQSQARHTGAERSVFKDPGRSRSTYDTLPAHIVDTIVRETRDAGLGRFLRPPETM